MDKRERLAVQPVHPRSAEDKADELEQLSPTPRITLVIPDLSGRAHAQDRKPYDDECICGLPWPCAILAEIDKRAELQDKLLDAEAVIAALKSGEPSPRIRGTHTINGEVYWCDDCGSEFDYMSHAGPEEPVKHTEGCPGVALAVALALYDEKRA